MVIEPILVLGFPILYVFLVRLSLELRVDGLEVGALSFAWVAWIFQRGWVGLYLLGGVLCLDQEFLVNIW